MKKLMLASAIFLPFSVLAQTPPPPPSVKQVALNFCQTNYANGQKYFGQADQKFSSWKECLNTKIKEYSPQKTYQPTEKNVTYAKQYCSRSFLDEGKNVKYGGLAEAEQPGWQNKVNLNAFTTYESCVAAKTEEDFFGSEAFTDPVPYTQTTPEERAENFCAGSREYDECYAKKVEEFREYDEMVATQREAMDFHGDEVKNNPYTKCAQENSDCGGKMPVRVGKLEIDTQLLFRTIELSSTKNCALEIDYFRAHIYGPNEVKLPDGRSIDYGYFDNTIEQDYFYLITNLHSGKERDDCPKKGHGYYPETLTRQENIDLAMRLIGG